MGARAKSGSRSATAIPRRLYWPTLGLLGYLAWALSRRTLSALGLVRPVIRAAIRISRLRFNWRSRTVYFERRRRSLRRG
jgi:hypothetical protein